MSCADCDRALTTRASLRTRAAKLAADVTTAGYSPEQRAAFACFGLLLLGELATRCEGCATTRLMVGITAVAAIERH